MAVDRIEVGELIGLRAQSARVDLSSRRRVMTELAGSRVSGFRGRGMDFDEHRPYQAGDEARSIDWRVTARTGRMHVRVFREERERPVLLAVDLRRAMQFGTRGCFKSVLAARAAALIGWAAAKNGDRVGGVCFGGGRHEEIRPRAASRSLLQLFGALAERWPVAKEPDDLSTALQRLTRLAPAGSLVTILSDFRGLQRAETDLLRRLASRTELVFGFVHDPLESELPPPGAYPLGRSETNTPVMLDTGGRARRMAWREAFASRRSAVQQLARANNAHWLDLCTAVPAAHSIDRAFGHRRTAA